MPSSDSELAEDRVKRLVDAWNENRCGDAYCEDLRLRSAITVITGRDSHIDIATNTIIKHRKD